MWRVLLYSEILFLSERLSMKMILMKIQTERLMLLIFVWKVEMVVRKFRMKE